MNENKGTFKCPKCGTKVLKQTGYCLKCKKKVGKKEGELLTTASTLEECMDQFSKEYDMEQWSVTPEMSQEDVLASAVFPTDDDEYVLDMVEEDGQYSLMAVQKVEEEFAPLPDSLQGDLSLVLEMYSLQVSNITHKRGTWVIALSPSKFNLKQNGLVSRTDMEKLLSLSSFQFIAFETADLITLSLAD